MSKFLYAVTALLALQAVQTATAQSASDYLPLENPGQAQCIVKGAFNKDTSSYALKLGSCTDKNVAKLWHAGKGKELRTSDKSCLAPVAATAKPDVELVLTKCPTKITANGLKWTKVGRNQWQNGDKLCVEYVSKTKKFVQKKCATLEAGDKKSPQQWVFKAPLSIKCADWGKKWVCASGWTLNTQSGLTCVGATDASCANVCCMPVKTCRSAGYANRCPVDYKFVDRQCGNPGQRACGTDVCCEYDPKPIKCNNWNRCSRNFALKPRAKDIWCVRGKPVPGPNYAPTCSDDICCDKTVEQSTCGRWNSCDAGFEVKPNSYNKRCYVKAPVNGVMPLHHGGGATSEWCSNNNCCQKKAAPIPPPNSPSTCAASWKCNAKAGMVPKLTHETIKCYPAAPGSLNPRCGEQLCCEQDTCKNWSQRVVKKENGPFGVVVELSGEDVCRNDPAKYSGLMDKNDSRFTQPCMENGRMVECKPELCCIQNVMPIM